MTKYTERITEILQLNRLVSGTRFLIKNVTLFSLLGASGPAVGVMLVERTLYWLEFHWGTAVLVTWQNRYVSSWHVYTSQHMLFLQQSFLCWKYSTPHSAVMAPGSLSVNVVSFYVFPLYVFSGTRSQIQFFRSMRHCLLFVCLLFFLRFWR